MELSIEELRVLIDALGMLEAEYGLDVDRAVLRARLCEVRDRRLAEIERVR